MSRQFSNVATNKARFLLESIASPSMPVQAYRIAMTDIGRELAKAVQTSFLASEQRSICLVCTAEDADFLAAGMLAGFEEGGISPDAVRLVCFWNERLNRFEGDDRDSIDIAPVVRQYKEAPRLDGMVLISVSSIISTARVVQTNLSTLFAAAGKPARTIIASPVMMSGAIQQLASELRQWAPTLESLTFATDDERGEDRNVVPGIGGSIFARLGFMDKLSVVPDLVKQRRRLLAA